MPIEYHIPLATILLFMVNGFITLIIKNEKVYKGLSLLSFIVAIILTSYLLIPFWNGSVQSVNYQLGYYPSPWGNELKFTLIEVLFSLVFLIIALFITISGSKINNEVIEKSRLKFYYLMLNIVISSLLGLIYNNDLFTAYVLLEINTIGASALMVAKNNGESIRATIKYFIMSVIGSSMFLLGIANLYGLTGYLSMEYLNESISTLISNGISISSLTISFILLLIGLSVKSGLFPFHTWSPDSYSIATPGSSAMLSGLVSKGYVILSIKIVHRVFGLENLIILNIMPVLLILGALGMMSGSLFAILQKDVTRMTAYSSVSHIGYIFVAISLSTTLGIASALFHVLNHSITKSALFLTLGSISHKTGFKDRNKLGGVGVLMPYTSMLFIIAGFSIIGIPPTVGFNSKWYIVEAMMNSNYSWIVVILSISTLFSAAYWLPIMFRTFFSDHVDVYLANGNYKAHEFSFSNLWATGLLTLAIITLAFFSGPIYEKMVYGLNYF